jgi:mitogen-activated protein kinase 1/3
MLRKVIRELFILRKLSEIPNNIYTTKIIDVILPGKCKITSEDDEKSQEVLDLDLLTHIFVVMEVQDFDLKNMMDNLPQADVDEDHIITIMYNILSAVSFLHSANLVHRDLKPANILMDDNCQIKICDFGLTRAIPKRDKVETEIRNLQSSFNCNSSEETKEEFRTQMTEQLNNSRRHRQEKKRELSPFVQTRWYRAPEVILLEKQYNESIDIWSVGMILSELMRSSDKYQDN